MANVHYMIGLTDDENTGKKLYLNKSEEFDILSVDNTQFYNTFDDVYAAYIETCWRYREIQKNIHIYGGYIDRARIVSIDT